MCGALFSFHAPSPPKPFSTQATLCYAYYKEGAEAPTFLFPKYAMEEMKC